MRKGGGDDVGIGKITAKREEGKKEEEKHGRTLSKTGK